VPGFSVDAGVGAGELRATADAYGNEDQAAVERLEGNCHSWGRIRGLRWVQKDGHGASVRERNTAD
jgi:hypothetical protein